VSYFFIWLVWSGAEGKNAKFFIYLTNWAFLIFNLYLIIAALSSSITYFHHHWILQVHENSRYSPGESLCSPENPVGFWNKANNSLKWYQMIHWLFFSIGNGAAVLVTVLFWSLLYRGGSISGVSANQHLIHGIIAIVDIFICGLPVNVLHCIYTMTGSIAYSTFAGIYSISSGENIYGVLDYQYNAGSAVVLELLVTLLLIPLIYFVLYSIYIGRVLLLHSLNKWASAEERTPQEVELSDMEQKE